MHGKSSITTCVAAVYVPHGKLVAELCVTGGTALFSGSNHRFGSMRLSKLLWNGGAEYVSAWLRQAGGLTYALRRPAWRKRQRSVVQQIAMRYSGVSHIGDISPGGHMPSNVVMAPYILPGSSAHSLLRSAPGEQLCVASRSTPFSDPSARASG